jgi:hypothetical protein
MREIAMKYRYRRTSQYAGEKPAADRKATRHTGQQAETPGSSVPNVKQTMAFVHLCGDVFLLSLGARNRGFWHHGFRTAVSVGIKGSHRRDAKFFADGPPGQTFFVTKSHNLIPAKHTPGPSNNFPGSLSGPDAG